MTGKECAGRHGPVRPHTCYSAAKRVISGGWVGNTFGVYCWLGRQLGCGLVRVPLQGETMQHNVRMLSQGLSSRSGKSPQWRRLRLLAFFFRRKPKEQRQKPGAEKMRVFFPRRLNKPRQVAWRAALFTPAKSDRTTCGGLCAQAYTARRNVAKVRLSE